MNLLWKRSWMKVEEDVLGWYGHAVRIYYVKYCVGQGHDWAAWGPFFFKDGMGLEDLEDIIWFMVIGGMCNG